MHVTGCMNGYNFSICYRKIYGAEMAVIFLVGYKDENGSGLMTLGLLLIWFVSLKKQGFTKTYLFLWSFSLLYYHSGIINCTLSIKKSSCRRVFRLQKRGWSQNFSHYNSRDVGDIFFSSYDNASTNIISLLVVIYSLSKLSRFLIA